MSFEIRPIKAEKRPSPWKKNALSFVMVLRPILSWCENRRLQKNIEKEEHARTVLLKRIFATLIAILIVAGLLIVMASTMLSLKFSIGSFLTAAGSDLPMDAHGHTNVILMGTGDEGHQGNDLLDTIILASIDQKTESVFMLSIPRDLYVTKTEKMGVGRINSLYRDYKYYLMREEGMEESAAIDAAMKEFIREIGSQLGIEIHHYAKIDFTAFKEGVDAIGGIEINVPYDLVDTQYPTENYGYETFSITKGLHLLDGETALKYARSRHSTSDFSRSARQQQIILAAAQKAKALGLHKNIGKLTEYYRIFANNVTTSLSIGEMISFAGIAGDLDQSNVTTMQINSQNGLYGGLTEPGGFLYTPPREQFEGASVLLPVSIPEYPTTWKQLRLFADLYFTHRELYIGQPRIAVLNAGAANGAASLFGGELYRYGLNIDTIENYEGEETNQSFIAMRPQPENATGSVLPTMEFLTSLGLKEKPLPESVELPNTDIILVLGSDYQYRPLQDILQ